RRHNERRPISDVEMLKQQERNKGAHHVLGAVAEIDDVQHAEDDGKAEAEQRVERAIDQPKQELTEQLGRWIAKDLEHETRPPARGGDKVRPALGPISRSPADTHLPSADGRPRPQEWWHAACRSRRDISTPPAS